MKCLRSTLQVDENGQGIPVDKLDALLDYGHEGSSEAALLKMKANDPGSSKLCSRGGNAGEDCGGAWYGHFGHGLNLALMYLGGNDSDLCAYNL